jgi:hypothetical protein
LHARFAVLIARVGRRHAKIACRTPALDLLRETEGLQCVKVKRMGGER